MSIPTPASNGDKSQVTQHKPCIEQLQQTLTPAKSKKCQFKLSKSKTLDKYSTCTATQS